jgi:hypothetical protein
MANKKENVEIQNSHSSELPDDELEAVAGGVTPDMMLNDQYITVSGHILQKNCAKCGNDCWTYDYLGYHPQAHRWHCAVCEAAGFTERNAYKALTQLPASSYPCVELTVPVPPGG